MNRSSIAFLVAALAMPCDQGAAAQAAPGNPPRALAYDSLHPLVGRWTIKGSEDSFVEVCRWFDGEFHVVCDSEKKLPDGSSGKGMSVLSYVPDQGYVYYGISSAGRNQAFQQGTFQDGILEYRSSTGDDAKAVVTRVRMGPFTGREVPYVIDTSTERGAWVPVHSVTFVKLD